ncbi:hypothetical protein [Mesorhizobium sp. M0213]|uniref:hypothetical protein n=1 Tax=unclassified Mesorhizobium TaxID=325217 RepID=UPI00333AE794
MEDLFAEAELKQFLTVPFEALLEECRRTASRPNMEAMAGIDLAGSNRNAIYFWTTYKLRSGREVFHKRYFDRRLRLVLGKD